MCVALLYRQCIILLYVKIWEIGWWEIVLSWLQYRRSFTKKNIGEAFRLFHRFAILFIGGLTGPKDVTRLILVMYSRGKCWFSTSQHIRHMVTMVYDSSFTGDSPTDIFEQCLIFAVREWLISSIYCMFEVLDNGMVWQKSVKIWIRN